MTTKSARSTTSKSPAKGTSDGKKSKISGPAPMALKSDGVQEKPAEKTALSARNAAKNKSGQVGAVKSKENFKSKNTANSKDNSSLEVSSSEKNKTSSKVAVGENVKLPSSASENTSAAISVEAELGHLESAAGQKPRVPQNGVSELGSHLGTDFVVSKTTAEDNRLSVHLNDRSETSYRSGEYSGKVSSDQNTQDISFSQPAAQHSGRGSYPAYGDQSSHRHDQGGQRHQSRLQQEDSRDPHGRGQSLEQPRREFNQGFGANGNRDPRPTQGGYGGQGKNGHRDDSLIEVKVSGSLYRKLREIARNEGLSIEEFASELLAEGCVVRAWEVIERKAAMKGQAPGNNQNQNRNNNSFNNKQNYNPRSKQGRNNYNKIMEDNAHFLEYVRNQEKRQR